MKKRNIAVDLDTARGWYNGTNKTLKELALQAYSQDELEINWKHILDFSDARKALGLTTAECNRHINQLRDIPNSRMLIAQYKLAIIKKALNGDWDPKFNEGTIYYPWLRWYPKGNNYPDDYTKICMFKDTKNGKTYTLVGGYYGCCDGGLGYVYFGCGGSLAYLGLLGCKSRDIAKHMGVHFGKIIFEAIYGQYDNYELL